MATNYTVQKGQTMEAIVADLAKKGVKTTTGALWQMNKSTLDSNYAKTKNYLLAGKNIVTPNIPTATPTKTNIAQTTTPVPTEAPRDLQPTAPETPNELSDYLNKYQERLNSVTNYDAFGDTTDGQAIDEFANKIGVSTELPVPPKFTELFTTLRESYGIDNIETGINEYKKLIRDSELLLKQQNNYQKGQTVRQGVIGGRVDQNTRNRMEEIDWYKNNVSFLTDQANAGYNFINTMIELNKLDYDVAKDMYQTEFSNRLNLYNALSTEKRDERDFNYQMLMDEKKMASTNISMYVDLISKGQLKWSSLPADQQTALHKMEIQSGLGIGFLSTVKPPAGSEIKQIIQRTDPVTGMGYADILYIDANGKLKTKTQKLGQAGLSLAQQQSLKSSSGSTSTKNSYGYTQSQWNTKIATARTYLSSLESKSQSDIYNEGGTASKKPDQTLADWEVKNMAKQFKAKFGDAGAELLYEALQSGGYKLWDFTTSKAKKVDWGNL